MLALQSPTMLTAREAPPLLERHRPRYSTGALRGRLRAGRSRAATSPACPGQLWRSHRDRLGQQLAAEDAPVRHLETFGARVAAVLGRLLRRRRRRRRSFERDDGHGVGASRSLRPRPAAERAVATAALRAPLSLLVARAPPRGTPPKASKAAGEHAVVPDARRSRCAAAAVVAKRVADPAQPARDDAVHHAADEVRSSCGSRHDAVASFSGGRLRARFSMQPRQRDHVVGEDRVRARDRSGPSRAR